jgi:hypothetical protein
VRLDPKKVRFVSPWFNLGLITTTLRFTGRENTVQLQETALAVEGNVLKVSLLGLELLFRRALAEWSAVTIPYSRITKVRYQMFSPLRRWALIALVLIVAGAVGLFLYEGDPGVILLGLLFGSPALVLTLILHGRVVIRFRAKGGRPTVLMLRIRSKKLRKEFLAKLAEYREAARRFAPAGWTAEAVDPVLAEERQKGRRLAAVLAVMFVLTTGLLGLGVWAVVEYGEFDRPAPQPRVTYAKQPVYTIPPQQVAKGRPTEVAPPPRPVRAVEVAPPPRPNR